MKLHSKSEIDHYYRFVKQYFFKPEIAVIGGYFGGNLGDIALGQSVENKLEEENVKGAMQTIYNLEKWPMVSKAIIGGGAIGTSENLKIICERYKGSFNKVAIVGVDFNEKAYSKEAIQLICEASYVSCRSKIQADKLIKISGRSDINNHADLVFALHSDFCNKIRKNQELKSTKLLLVNVLPLFATIINGNIEFSEAYHSERPDLLESNSFQKMHSNYRKLLSEVIEKAIADGFKIETIPFTPEDVTYGKIILKGLPVKHNSYDAKGLKMLRKMSKATKIIATRLHATIFALKLGKPFLPIAYAYKNEELLKSIGVDRSQYITTSDLSIDIRPSTDFVMGIDDKIKNSEKSSNDALKECVKSLKSIN